MGKLILTYHCARLESRGREGNDLLALQEDLPWLAAQGVPVHPLERLLDPACTHGVALTFDDGTRIDAEAIEHPTLGPLPSLLGILEANRHRFDALQGASFVIASPQARSELSAALAADYGPELMHDRWWRAAADSGLLSIENHSWDHNHPLVARSAQRDNRRGSFFDIETEAEAEAEIARASDFIAARCGRRPRWFAYPFGEASAFLRDDYLPRRGPQLGLAGALGTEPAPLTAEAPRWNLPRFVCGRDWRDRDGLARLFGVHLHGEAA